MGESRRFQIGWSLLWVDHCQVYWVDKWKVYFEVEFSFGSEHLSQPEIQSPLWPKKKTSLCFWASLTSAVAPTVSTQTGYNLKNLKLRLRGPDQEIELSGGVQEKCGSGNWPNRPRGLPLAFAHIKWHRSVEACWTCWSEHLHSGLPGASWCWLHWTEWTRLW